MRLAIATFLSAVSAIPSSSMVKAITAAAKRLVMGRTLEVRFSPSSKLSRIDDGLAGNALERFFHHVGFGGIHQDRCGNTGCNFLQNGSHVALLILTDYGAAQVEHVRAVIH